jgi:hypothetical protein
MNYTLTEALERIERLEGVLVRNADRIEQLEAALREIDNMAPATCEMTLAHQMADIASAALNNLCKDDGCPNAGTPHVCINRQENDDVYPGFRGNNEA